MKKVKVSFIFIWFLSSCTSNNVSQITIKQPSQEKNILFLFIDDLRPELKSFGAKHIHSPNIDELAANSRVFLNQYVNSPSCGPSRYSLLTGRYGPSNNSALQLRGKAIKNGLKGVSPSMPEWFKQHGYTTVSVGKVSHLPGGRGGEGWADDTKLEMPNAWTKHLMPVGEWQTPKGMMHGLAHGEVRNNAKDMDLFQSAEGGDSIYPDGLITDEAIKQLKLLSQDKHTPFFLAVGIIKPHLPFGAPKKYLDLYEGVEFPEIPYPNKPLGLSTWHGSGEFMKYNRWGKNPITDHTFAEQVRRHYAASVSYADAQVGKILKQLKESGADKNTIVVLWGDHGWNLGEHAIWGKHNLYEEGLRSPLLISYPNMPMRGVSTTAVVESASIFPTLTKLVGLPDPQNIHGRSIIDQVANPKAKGQYAYSYRGKDHTLRMQGYRLTLFNGKDVALYDHNSAEKETNNVAALHPDIVNQMLPVLKARMLKNDKY
ncbi:sulfatase [Paraglaciecola aquimarina]|uniref:Sulfatase n=1 Tax=Paraglaciecola algarum TaxID=3050085 RepID=A0ABS9D2M6_9ALTE|nr:sulfatase [Paraglaciecola sp. G1-23]MCF2947165.1 sulfatase [Paraglaciecola sp. G1-23]